MGMLSFLILTGTFLAGVHAIGQDTCVVFTPSSSTVPIVSKGVAAPILISPDEWAGVQRAASDFADDIQRVTGIKPTLSNVTSSSKISAKSTPIIVGTLGHSTLIDQIVNTTKLDVSSLQGQWESFLSVEVKQPLPGIDNAYVIIGADKRGTIYAMYDHSEQFGAFILFQISLSLTGSE